jgi:predicted nucleic acid-binding Zn ribbon protein
MNADTSPTPSELGRRLVQARRVVEGACRVCGKPFKGAPNRRYCTDKCRWHHYRHREREEAFTLQHRLAAVRVGTASVFLDADGYYWMQFECLRGPKAGEPGYPADPAPKVLAASYRALFRAFANESKQAEEDSSDAEA